MSSFYDLASLVMIPSGKKAGKVYSQKPLTTDGQLDFTRASTATRIGPTGLIEKTRTNELTYSNDFSNAVWNKSQSGGATPVLTSGFTDPNGGSNAWRLECSITSGSYSMMTRSLSTTGLNCNSIYIKSNTGSDQDVYFRLDNGDQTTTRTATASWQRIQVFSNAVGQSYTIGVRDNATGSTSSCDVLIYAAQTEQGLVATSYIETTTAAVSVGSVDNMPRLNYTPGSATSCPSLLLEPQRTNLIAQSEYFDTWTLIGGGTVTTNTSVSPDGNVNAATIEPLNYARNIFTMSGGSNTFSIYFKGKDANCVVRIGFLGPGDSGLIFTDETITTSEWKRINVTYTNATAPLGVFFSIQSGDNDVYAYGAQVEAGSYATSYIPTFGATVTRVSDTTCNITNFLSKGIISTALTWTVFFDLEGLSTNNNIGDSQFIAGADSTLDVYVRPENENSLFARFYWRKDGKYIGSNFGKKIIARLSGGTGTTFVDGALNNSSSISGDYSLLGITRNSNSVGKINKILIFPTALTDAQCIELTT
tara:strand:- start:340 stop:1941 length:1602 start_codon:yes stop_codon:yes gene_type:complete